MRSLWDNDVACTGLAPLPPLPYYSWQQILASWVQSGFSVLTQQAQHKSISHKKARPSRKPLNPISQTCLFQSARSTSAWAEEEWKTQGSQSHWLHTVCGEQVHFRCNSFLSHVMHVRVCEYVCAQVQVQVTSSPLKWNAILDPSFQISFPNLELSTVTVVSRERVVSLVLL